MAVKIALDSFLAVIRRSNLVNRDQLAAMVESFEAEGGETGNTKAFAEHLIRKKVLTPWQAEKLLQGKHKGFFLGKYRLLSLLGKGGMSSVYLAEHVLMRRRCAIKVLPTRRVHDASYLGRFHREAQAVASLDHPNIVRAYDVDHELDGDMEIHFLVMEFVDGKSLLEIVQHGGPLSPKQAAEYIRQAALGLQHAHAAGLVHRDIKPGNLLVDTGGTVKVLDLGLARFFDTGEETSLTVQHDERVLGTADYLAPEQAVDSHGVDARADIYSLGCTLYFCLTGHPPFTQGTLAQRLLAHQTREPTTVESERPDMPAELSAILKRMMSKQASDRQQTATRVSEELEGWLKSGTSGVDSTDSETIVERRESSVTVAPPQRSATQPKPATGESAPGPVPGRSGDDALGAFLSNLNRDGSADASGHEERPIVNTSPPVNHAPPPAAQKPAGRPKSPGPRPPDATPAPAATFTPGFDFVPPAEDIPAESAGGFPQLAIGSDSGATAIPHDSGVGVGGGSGTLSGENSVSSSIVAARKRRQQKSGAVWMWVGGAALLLIAVVAYAMSRGGGETPQAGSGQSTPPVAESDPEVVIQPPQATARNLGPELQVGPSGDFRSIAAAVEYIKEHRSRFTADQPWVVQVAGGQAYDERIEIEGSGFSGLPPGVRITSTGDAPAVLRPQGKEPVIRLEGIERLTISGFVIDAAGKDRAVALSNFLVGTRLENLEIRDVGGVAILADDASGLSGAPLVLSGIRISSKSPSAVGLRLIDPNQVQIDDCRFAGPMQTGIEFASETWNADIRVAHCRFHELNTAIRFSGGSQDLQRVAIANNTFHRVQQGIAFARMPQAGSSGFAVHHNLFADVSGPEAAVGEGFDAAAAVQLLDAGSARNNWTTRASGESQAGEWDIVGENGRRGIATVGFVSRDPVSADFLKPTDPALRNELQTPAQGADPFVGAVSP